MPKTKKVTKVKKSEVQKTESSKKIPIGVKIISILYYIAVGFFLITGLFIISFSGVIISTIISMDATLASVVTSGLVIGVGISLLILSVLVFFISRGLWKLRLWAKITVITISLLMVIYEIYLIITTFAFMQLIQLAIHAAIGIYLIFNKEAKKAFG
jgi:hypothetical protein